MLSSSLSTHRPLLAHLRALLPSSPDPSQPILPISGETILGFPFKSLYDTSKGKIAGDMHLGITSIAFDEYPMTPEEVGDLICFGMLLPRCLPPFFVSSSRPRSLLPPGHSSCLLPSSVPWHIEGASSICLPVRGSGWSASDSSLIFRVIPDRARPRRGPQDAPPIPIPNSDPSPSWFPLPCQGARQTAFSPPSC